MFREQLLSGPTSELWKRAFLACPQAILVTTLDEELVDLNDSARELLQFENEIIEAQRLESVLGRIPHSVRKLIRPQKVSVEIQQRNYFLVYLHDSREQFYSQRLLSFFATTLKSLDNPKNVSTSCHEVLSDAARVAIKSLSDWCQIDLRADIRLGRGLALHKNKKRQPLLTELQKIDFLSPDDILSPLRVLRSGVAVFRDDVSEDLLKTLSEAPRTFALFQKMELQSYICVPIKKGEDTLGSITFARAVGSERFDTIDLMMAEEFANKLGVNLELALLYKNLAEMKNAAEAASQTKTNFLANVSHEIRTPLSAVLGFSELLVSTSASLKERLDWGGKIRSSGGHLLRIIDDILDLSKVEAGKLDLDIKTVNFKKLLQEVCVFANSKAAGKNLKVEFLFEEPLPQFVLSDETRLSQILLNILGNAIKFTPTGYVRVKVGNLNAKENLIYFEVSDSGIGVGENQAALLFQPFSQGDTTHTRKFGGTGLGLALSRNLAQRLGGNIILKESLVGAGSTFLITIKAPPVGFSETFHQLDSAETAPSQEALEKDLSQILRDQRILIVEDSTDMQALIKRILESAGATVEIAENGEDGIHMANKKSYDVILMDVQMPVMDGCQAVQELRILGYPGLVVALTANAMKEEHDRCLQAGFDAHLSKPMRRQDLIENIHRLSSEHSRH